jgi:hypothetical protein
MKMTGDRLHCERWILFEFARGYSMRFPGFLIFDSMGMQVFNPIPESDLRTAHC